MQGYWPRAVYTLYFNDLTQGGLKVQLKFLIHRDSSLLFQLADFNFTINSVINHKTIKLKSM